MTDCAAPAFDCAARTLAATSRRCFDCAARTLAATFEANFERLFGCAL